jgi:hypothetical protein
MFAKKDIVLAVAGLAAVWTASSSPQREARTGGAWTQVTLARRHSAGEYESSAYSFRDALLGASPNRNDVDLVYCEAGILHFASRVGIRCRAGLVEDDASAAASSRIGFLPGSKEERDALNDISKIPASNWMSKGVEPLTGQLWVMEVDDGDSRLRLQLRVLSVNESHVALEWTPLRSTLADPVALLAPCKERHWIR